MPSLHLKLKRASPVGHGYGQTYSWRAAHSNNLRSPGPPLPGMQAAWGALQKNMTQLMIRSYELGVLLLPGLEAAYLASRHRGFSCTPGVPAAAPAGGGAGRATERRSWYCRWQARQEGRRVDHGEMGEDTCCVVSGW